MAKILKISREAIDESMQGVTRQYLVGQLQKPQALHHIPNGMLEIGMTRYGPEGGREQPHKHRQAVESQYMVAGTTAYLDTETGEEHVFRKGDFYLIEPGVAYAQKADPNTEILFIKVPPGNDKITIEPTPEVQLWFEKPIPA